jgi:hypothetical protein
MQCSTPETYNAVQDLSCHIHKAVQDHFKAMLRILKYSLDTVEQGLLLKPNRKWDGSQSHKFVISRRLDSDYAKEPKDRHSALGHVVYLLGVPPMFKSSTERTVSLSTTKAETYAGVTCVQYMLYMKNILELLGLKVKLPMVLEMDNQGAVYLANNWSVGGRTNIKRYLINHLLSMVYRRTIFFSFFSV